MGTEDRERNGPGLRGVLLLAVVVVAATAVLAGAASAHGGSGNSNATAPVCDFDKPEWREAQTVAGVEIQESRQCRPDNPAVVAASVKGTNNVPKKVLMDSGLARSAVVKKNDIDGDGDPDVIHITLELTGINEFDSRTDEIAPGVAPAFWTFAPKTRGMVRDGSKAEKLERMPSPPIRVEQGDVVKVTVQNTHYFPHTVHFHGVDHGFEVNGEGNDGVPQTSEKPIMPGEERTYEFRPREPGTMFYHCHVVPNVHVTMGLNGMFVVEENESNNRVQTFNIGAGKVRHPSKGTLDNYTGEFDLHYQGVDKELHRIPQQYNDPRVIAKKMNREYDATERDPDYFLLNGKSFPYTVRESLITVEQGERYRLRVSNGGSETVSLHTHGHKFTIEAYDGVQAKEGAEVQRDVVTITAAQRVDLALNTTNDGLHSYGPGIWFTHDHREQAVTTDGISPGGTPTMIVYEEYIHHGVPETKTDLSGFFSEDYYEGEVPFWKSLDEERFGAPPANATNESGEHHETEAGGSDGTNALGGGSIPDAGAVLAIALAGGAVGFLARGRRDLAVVLVALLVLASLPVAPVGLGAADPGHGDDTDTATPTPAGTDGDGSHDDGSGDDGHHDDGSGMSMSGGMMMDMQMVENGTVINGNSDELPPGCEEIRGTREVTVRAGSKYAEPGEMFGYSKDNFEFAPCTKVSVTVVNEDHVRHQWMVHGLPKEVHPMGMFNIEVNGPGQVTGTFVTPANGSYDLHCSLPQHEQKGMHATIDITGDAAAASNAIGPGFGPGAALIALLALAGVALRARD